MMGHRQEFKSDDEVDAILARAYLRWRSGERKAVKRSLMKRIRRDIKLELKKLDARRK